MSSTTSMDVFEITGPLPGIGTTVLEASAGTGKTYAVAALATRFVAEAVAPLEELLVITFSRAATQELRDRVREMFVAAAAALAPGEAPTSGADDPLFVALTVDADGRPLPEAELATRRRRLLDAVANYDAATIATTHEFCNAVLRSLGVAGDSDSTETLREDISALSDEVVEDHYLARYAQLEADPPIRFRDARHAATRAVENPHAALRPTDAEAGTEQEALVSFAEGVRDELEVRKRRAGVFTYDDMLSRLARAVAPDRSAAAERMRARWSVVLVDEFQDTDPVQWAVLEHAFAAETRLVLIGDPKQAIYAFRGGDTPTYLRAVADAPTATLGVNWRSDAAVVEALQVLTGGAQLGDERIVVHEVHAAPHLAGSRLSAGGGVRLRQVRRDGFSLTKSGTINIGKARDHIAADVAADIARQLNAGVTLAGRRLSPGDFAVLLHSVKEDAPRIQAELSRLGIPSVVNTAESVMLSPAATYWLRLLEAMEKPQLPGRIRAAALTPFFATTADDLIGGGDDLTDDLAERVRGWLDLLRSRGIAAVHGAASVDGLARRVLAQEGGERLLTDLTHVGQLLHRAGQEERLGVTGLLGWLRTAIDEGNRNDSRRRRLDVDAEAVQFVTIHGSKGLEYPIVYLPQLFDRSVKDWPTVHAYHEDGLRCLDVADSPRAKALARAEDAQEDLRLAYVAMTRACAQVTLWWAPTWNAPNGALTRLLFGRGPGDAAVPERAPVGEDDAAADEVLRAWAAAGAFVVEPTTPVGEKVELPPAAAELAARAFDRDLDTEWRRTSYSGLIRAEDQVAHGTGSEPEQAGTDDEDDPEDVEPADELDGLDTDQALLSPMNGLPAGATFGSLVHAVLEHTDPQADDLRAEVLARVEEERRWWSVAATSEELADALLPMQRTPLGPLADDLTLVDIGMGDRMCELDFEFPMADGDATRPPGAGPAGLPLAEFAGALRRHLPADDPVRPYADRLEAPALGGQVLRGYLSGSIDVVLRVGDGGDQRFVVVDYKTNTLGDPTRPLTALDYTPAKVGDAMLHSHYPLQALLYSVVLHRYLRWRLPGYDAEQHLGGAADRAGRGALGDPRREADVMTAALPEIEPTSRRRALRATGLLGTFNDAGVLEAADVHVAQRLGALAQEPDQSVLLAAALAVRAARAGAVCVDLDRIEATVTEIEPDRIDALPWPERIAWKAAVASSVLARAGVLRVDEGLLYLDRHWREEKQVCDDLLRRLERDRPDLEHGPAIDEDLLDAGSARLFPATWDEQRDAALAAARRWTTVLTGGPGTGKTTTVARLLALVSEQHESRHGQPPRVALAAPTGKAATRLQESVAREAARLTDPADRARVSGLTASTVHRLLGWRPDSGTRFRHRRDNPLPYDVVVVDEVSMVSLVQMARLLEAVRDTTRLVLVGDPGQLASVEAGAVLADIVAGFEGSPRSPVVSLATTYRTRAADGTSAVDLDLLATDLRAGDDDAVVARLTSGSDVVRLVDPADEDAMAQVRDSIRDAAYTVTLRAEQFDEPDAAALVDLLDDHRLLCAHREGPFGVGGWNRQVQRMVEERTGVQHFDEWYPGRPVLVTANDPGLGLSNGDLGITVRLPDGRLRVLVRIAGATRLFAPTRLSGVETV
ncbi:MAG: exodeoxyribonuclease V subunit alpha, partial [Propionibacteriales bacterium]|nr:exodeoxyribonuclease V subunit alpha [Propionibacteriales bacterium]